MRATSRSPHALAARFSGLETIASDFMDQRSLEDALQDIEIAYYLVHSMETRDFEERDRIAARNFLAAAQRARVERIVYLSGLGRAEIFGRLYWWDCGSSIARYSVRWPDGWQGESLHSASDLEIVFPTGSSTVVGSYKGVAA